MSRPRKPTAVHALTGAIEHDPGRFADRAREPIDDRPLGPPPESMRPDQRAAWMEIERLAPWLAFADRLAVEVTSWLLARFRLDASSMPPALLTRLETMLGRLGLTPSDRSKVAAPTRAAANRFSGNGKRNA
jgi:hypothetical protein